MPGRRRCGRPQPRIWPLAVPLLGTLVLLLWNAISCLPFVPPLACPKSNRRWPQQIFPTGKASPEVDGPIATPPKAPLPHDENSMGDIPIPRERFLVHRGKSADMIFRAPAISGMTVCRNWTPLATQALVQATHDIVKNNPILSGIVVRQGGNAIVTGELWIEAGWHTPDNRSFVSFLPVPSNATHRELSGLSSASGSPTELLSYLEDRVEPCFRHLATPTSLQAEKRLPLLDVSIMIVPSQPDDQSKVTGDKDGGGDCAIFSLTVSHAVGDGVTFFQILRELSVRMTRLDPSRRLNGEWSSPQLSIPAIDWTARSRISHEIYPVTYSRRDVDVAYGLTFLVGLIKNAILTLTKRKPTIVLLDKAQVKREKVRMRKLRNCTSLSSNDVVSLALCEANHGDSDVFIFTENARDGIKIPLNAGGNFFWEIPFSSRDAVADPRSFRGVVESKRPVYPSDQLPMQPFLCGKVGRLTSLATVVSEPIVFGNVQTVCTFPVTAFLHDIPMDIALIFRYNRHYLGVLHNFVSLDCRRGSLLDSIIFRTSLGKGEDESESEVVGADP